MQEPITIKTSYLGRMDDDAFFHFCQENSELVIERDHEGTIFIMSPTGLKGGNREATLISELGVWNKTKRLGEIFSSSTGFTLPDSSMFSPDAAFVRNDRLGELSKEEIKKFAPIAPDFVAEIRSSTDKLDHLHRKMERYILNGVQLAWLIDPEEEKAWVYLPGREVETFLGMEHSLSGGEVLPGFEFPLSLLK